MAKPQIWTDDIGVTRPVPKGKRLVFMSGGHAALRAFVFRRDNFTCAGCGIWPDVIPSGYTGRYTVELPGRWRFLDIDHKHPRSKGGTHHPDNLRPMCFPCNSAKCDRVPEGGNNGAT